MLAAPEPILTAHLFAPLHQELMSLLRSLSDEEWNAPTAAGTWKVRDVAAHLLDTAMRRVSIHRDGYMPPFSFDINRINAEAVTWAQRLSVPVLLELHETYGAQQAAFLASLDPFADALWGVSWAGEEHSPMWFDVARELTERWHHQQQIRDATGRGLLRGAYLAPVLDTFARALPHTYRSLDAPPSTSVVLRIDDQSWTLVRDSSWTLFSGGALSPTTQVTMTGDIAWRLFTKGLRRGNVRATIEGDASYAEPVLGMVAVIG
ncbi:MAG TPA: maleylpyruvate isomerase family mycothiol-dependent enzyme [Thermoanaerobaculia bacterium]|nr:maleylpyruvate isomerase family mycothiol-dependent enzyme [Thermoanaerobaculia bacterium]